MWCSFYYLTDQNQNSAWWILFWQKLSVFENCINFTYEPYTNGAIDRVQRHLQTLLIRSCIYDTAAEIKLCICQEIFFDCWQNIFLDCLIVVVSPLLQLELTSWSMYCGKYSTVFIFFSYFFLLSGVFLPPPSHPTFLAATQCFKDWIEHLY